MTRFFSIEPLLRAGRIFIGASREDVRKFMGEFTEFKKSKFSKNTTDNFGSCHVYYDQDNKVEAVEIFNNAIAEYKKKNLFIISRDEIMKLFSSEPDTNNDDTLGYSDYGIIIGFVDNTVDSILVSRFGY